MDIQTLKKDRYQTMTQMSYDARTQSLLNDLIRVARERSARGNATAADWRSIAEIDEERARRELSRYLQTHRSVSNLDINPYERNRRSVGTVLGFVLGALGMVVMWIWGVPYLQEAWAGITYGPGVATALTYVSTTLVPLGAWVGSRWDRGHQQPDVPPPSPTDSTFDELLQRFTRSQNRSRTRVY